MSIPSLKNSWSQSPVSLFLGYGGSRRVLYCPHPFGEGAHGSRGSVVRGFTEMAFFTCMRWILLAVHLHSRWTLPANTMGASASASSRSTAKKIPRRAWPGMARARWSPVAPIKSVSFYSFWWFPGPSLPLRGILAWEGLLRGLHDSPPCRYCPLRFWPALNDMATTAICPRDRGTCCWCPSYLYSAVCIH